MNQAKQQVIVVIGGGAAGFFAAIHAAENFPNAKVILLEKTTKVLTKVSVSGGGRCNVTHACFDDKLLVKNYPRGEKQLLQAFHQFSTKDTVDWFERRNVPLKVEGDGRMFPESNSSQSIVNCLMTELERCGVKLRMQNKLIGVERYNHQFNLHLEGQDNLLCDKLIVTQGGSSKTNDYHWLRLLGHNIISPVPSLFTFNVPGNPISSLMGLSVQAAKVTISGTKLVQQAPLLITHWGFSGPAILKLSAWGARILNEKQYQFEFRINWIPEFQSESMRNELLNLKQSQAGKQVNNFPFKSIPKRLWDYFLERASIKESTKWAEISNASLNKLSELLCNDIYQANGKTTFKEEFVTCGGVDLKEVDFRTMQSKVCPNLFFAGEVLDIDGVTGGFNFQAAWTTSWIAAKHLND